MNRLGLAPDQFYQLTPAEFHYALKDYEGTHNNPTRNVCETLRLVAVIFYNSAFGRKKKDMIRNPKHLFAFGWDTPTQKRQTVEEMKNMIKAIGIMYGPRKKDKPTC